MRLRFAPATLALWAALLAGTAHAALFDDDEARKQINQLKTQADARQKTIEERLAAIDARLGQLDSTGQNRAVDLAQLIDSLKQDMAKLRGQIEVLSNQIETAGQRQKDLYLDIDTRLRKLEQAREQAAANPPPDKPAASAAAEPSPAETRAYQAALDQFKLGNYALAVSAMQGFMVTYPDSKLAPNAQYWIGMAHSGQRNYKEAIAAQRKLLAAWPDAEKAPDAMLSIASAQETMGDRKSAQRTLEELIARFPNSSSAASAKQRLAAFKR
jgi:tol-pal system protein YbgF